MRIITHIAILALAAQIMAVQPAVAQPQQAEHPFVTLWKPGSRVLQGAGEKEITVPPDPKPGDRINSIRNVHNPGFEVWLAPKGKANGCAILVAPGGGHQQLVWGSEGIDIARWLNDLGVSAFILKYRLAKTHGYSYTVEGDALRDTLRSIRIIRLRAPEWGVDPNRVGILGFSAGGALAALADIRFDRGKPDSADPIGRESSRPDFVGLVYPGWQPMDITAPKEAAPAFLTSAGLDDAFHARQTVEFHNSLFNAGVPSELHIYAHGGHGRAINPRNGIPFGTWHLRFKEWLADLGMLGGASPAAGR